MKTHMSVAKLAGVVYREEGITGFFRGLWIPLTTISFVRKSHFTPLTINLNLGAT